MSARESRPSNAEAAPESSTKTTASSIPRQADVKHLTRRHEYGLLVVTERSDGVMVSQVCLSLAAADRRADRARQRNLFASVSLLRLTPVVGATDADLALVVGEAV